ncbi:MAG: T9SS type A sorting domain-containing protein [Chitinophagales bacterium]|nr:T9SS type A sorting domain-containing protein [Chitinophagales bacterium]
MPDSSVEKSAVYPNPFSSNATLILSTAARNAERVSIYAVTGQTLMEMPVNDQPTVTLNLFHLSEVMYLLHIHGAGVNEVLKFIVR